MVPADSHRITRVPRYSGYHWAVSRFGYGPVTLCGTPFQGIPLALDIPCRGPTTPAARRHAAGLGSSPFARHYWGNHCLFSLPAGTKMFQFPAFASLTIIRDTVPSGQWVVPFGDWRITGYLLLPATFRSLSRPSSPL